MGTATKVRRSNIRFYGQVVKHTETPLDKRRELNIGRGGVARQPRKFHLDASELETLTAAYKETKAFPNPHNKGFYHYFVQSLIDLGINDSHPASVVMKRVEKLMSNESTIEGEGKEATTAWDRFTGKDPRNADTGKDWEGRFEQNVVVLQRLWSSVDPTQMSLTPYGLKILEVGQKVMGHKGGVIDVLVGPKGGVSYRLNTRSDRPINESKTRGMGSPAAIAAAKAEARASKKSTKTSKPRKSKVKTEDVVAPATATSEVAESTTAAE